MNIIEAIKSGRRFRIRQEDWYERSAHETRLIFAIMGKDIIADDWEIEEEKIEVTRDQVQQACHKAYYCSSNLISFTDILLKELKELGFK